MLRRATDDHGIALLVVMLALTLLTGLGTTLLMVTMTETAIAGSYAQASQTFYAAEAVVEYAVQEIDALPDWTPVASGEMRSTFTDPSVVAMVAPDDTSRAWSLFAYGRLDDLIGAERGQAPFVLAVWVAPDPATPGGLALLGRAYGSNGSQRAVEVTIVRPDTPDADSPPRVTTWREVR